MRCRWFYATKHTLAMEKLWPKMHRSTCTLSQIYDYNSNPWTKNISANFIYNQRFNVETYFSVAFWADDGKLLVLVRFSLRKWERIDTLLRLLSWNKNNNNQRHPIRAHHTLQQRVAGGGRRRMAFANKLVGEKRGAGRRISILL